MTCRRGQLTVEFLIILSVFMVLFLILFSKAQTDRSYADDRLVEASARVILEDAGGRLNALVIAGSNSKTSISLPGVLATGVNYEVEIVADARLLEMRWPTDVPLEERSRAQVPLLTDAFFGITPTPGWIIAAEYTDGVIVLG